MREPRTWPPAPEIHLVRGEPSDEELAALIAVLAGLAGASRAELAGTRSAWADPARRLRTPVRPGPGTWGASMAGSAVWPRSRSRI
ncbi:MAG: acyl-CoA carboxylase subunit epsilon [Pseudonocardiaceae bacterium]